MSKYIVVGGVAGGATATARLRRLDEQAEIIMVERGADISFANCGLPYFVGDTIKNREDLLVMTPARFKGLFNVDVRTNSEVIRVDTKRREVTIKNNGQEYTESYDALLLSPGATPLRPPIPGIDHKQIVTLRNVQDSVILKELTSKKPKGRVVVVGGGFIGIESAENLRQRGLDVTIVEAAPHILAPFDTDMVKLAEDELIRNGIKLLLGNGVQEFLHHEDNSIGVKLSDGQLLHADFVVMAIGVRPDTAFLQDSDIELGERGHILVNERMQTSASDVYAVGDAVMTFDSQTGKATALPLAGPANRQGRLAADNIAGLDRKYRGVVGSSVLKVFDLTAASTGKNERTLEREGWVYGKDYRFTITYPADHATYYPGAAPFALKMLFSLKDGKVLGAQAIGKKGADKRIDVIASVLRFGGTIHDLMDLELSYAPPFSSAKDPVNMAGYFADNIMTGLTNPILPRELADAHAKGALVIDLRDPAVFAQKHIDGATNIPTAKLRESLSKLPKNKPLILACKTGLNGYFMERMMKQAGFNARDLMGGYSYLNSTLPK